jgi:hypothetical protein
MHAAAESAEATAAWGALKAMHPVSALQSRSLQSAAVEIPRLQCSQPAYMDLLSMIQYGASHFVLNYLKVQGYYNLLVKNVFPTQYALFHYHAH